MPAQKHLITGQLKDRPRRDTWIQLLEPGDEAKFRAVRQCVERILKILRHEPEGSVSIWLHKESCTLPPDH